MAIRPRLTRCLPRVAAAVALLTFLVGCDLPSGTRVPMGPRGVVYVDAEQGSDETGDGTSSATAFRSIARALREIPSTVDTTWTVLLAPGEYRESLAFTRFLMPSSVNVFQLRRDSLARSITLRGVGSTADRVVIAPAGADRPCISATSVTLFLESLACRVEGYQGISASGSTLVLDDVEVSAAAPASNGIYIEDSKLFLGGSVRIVGPFLQGLAIRSNSVARSGTRLHPAELDLSFEGMELAIFLRDNGNLTNAFEAMTVTATGVREIAYAILGSRVFLSSGAQVRGVDLRSGDAGVQHRGIFGANHQSGINVHHVTLTGDLGPLIRCYTSSYVVIENGSYQGTPEIDTDGSCLTRH